MGTNERLAPAKARQTDPHQEPEGRWAVFVHNDDLTPMDFVVHILVTVFDLPRQNAFQAMYTAHLNDRAYVGSFSRAEALRRVGRARFAARLRRYPLEFSIGAE